MNTQCQPSLPGGVGFDFASLPRVFRGAVSPVTGLAGFSRSKKAVQVWFSHSSKQDVGTSISRLAQFAFGFGETNHRSCLPQLELTKLGCDQPSFFAQDSWAMFRQQLASRTNQSNEKAATNFVTATTPKFMGACQTRADQGQRSCSLQVNIDAFDSRHGGQELVAQKFKEQMAELGFPGWGV